jgi:hypothetical protein
MRPHQQQALFRAIVLMGATLTSCGALTSKEGSGSDASGASADASRAGDGPPPGLADAQESATSATPDGEAVLEAGVDGATADDAERPDAAPSEAPHDAAAVLEAAADDATAGDACVPLPSCCLRGDPLCCMLPYYGCIR